MFPVGSFPTQASSDPTAVKVSVEVPEQVSVPLLIVPPLKDAVAEIVRVYPLQSSLPEVLVIFSPSHFPQARHCCFLLKLLQHHLWRAYLKYFQTSYLQWTNRCWWCRLW